MKLTMIKNTNDQNWLTNEYATKKKSHSGQTMILPLIANLVFNLIFNLTQKWFNKRHLFTIMRQKRFYYNADEKIPSNQQL